MEDYKKVDAKVTFEAYCHCPYCGAYNEVFEDIREYLDEFNNAENLDEEINCIRCNNIFIIENAVN